MGPEAPRTVCGTNAAPAPTPSGPVCPRGMRAAGERVSKLLPGIGTPAKDSRSGGHSALFVRANKSPLVSVPRSWGHYVLITEGKWPALGNGDRVLRSPPDGPGKDSRPASGSARGSTHPRVGWGDFHKLSRTPTVKGSEDLLTRPRNRVCSSGDTSCRGLCDPRGAGPGLRPL